ncbi:MAG TPA: hypothetical protein DCW72_10570 [Elusimicrobia bacterium]|nr:MAG: hypothetical protein A2X29_12610 [Elusimicrobia bacterium GWA2_64_40]OGR64519.1 MAG: hypothetical protein A2X30_00350 [Elusimicrobia bacterium GWB2_63_16]HAN04233.1 hypothetical protein [Elusimicrobiota bacterium]HAU90623.1 hypothetical protein [Elusimicrobiota bacterium]
MEKKIAVMQRVMGGLIILLVLSDMLMKGAYLLAGFVALVIAVVLFARRKAEYKADERDIQIHLLACYGSLMATLCFTFIMQRFGAAGSLAYGNVQTVLVLSLVFFVGIFRKVWN